MDQEKQRRSKDDIAREHLGPQGVLGKPDRGKMTPQQEENIPKSGEVDGHPA